MTRLLDRVLDAHPDVVTACVPPSWPGEVLPSSLGAPDRENAVISALFEELRPGGGLGVWTGEDLLMTGCSAGASRFPVVAARYPDDADWVGGHRTGVCISDGVVDVRWQDHFVGDKASVSASCAARHQRVVTGYTTTSPSWSHTCEDSPGGQCACDPDHAHLDYPGDCADGDCVDFDSIVTGDEAGFALATGLSTADFAVTDWKLLSEGGSWRDRRRPLRPLHLREPPRPAPLCHLGR